MAGFSFSSSGATPSPFGYSSTPAPSPIGIGSTPAANALNKATAPTPPPIPQASTPVKKTTVNNVDGSSHTTEYHAPPAAQTDPAGGGGHAVIPTPYPGMLQSSAPPGLMDTNPFYPNAHLTTLEGTPVNQTSQVTSTQPTSQSQTSSGMINQNSGGQSSAPTFGGLLGGLSSFDPFANPAVSDAYKKAQGLNAAIAESKKNEAQGTATLLRQPIPLGDQEGQAQVLENQYLQQQAALGSELQGQSTLVNAGLTGTGQQLTGQSTAAGLAQPQLSSYGQTYYSPTQGGTVTPQPQTYQVQSGDTFSALAAQYGTTVDAIEAANPGLNPNNLQVGQQIKLPSQGSSTNGPFTAGQVAGNQALGQQYAQNVSANNQAKAIKTQIGTYLTQNPTLNPSQFSDVNSVLQLLNGKVSNAQYQVLSNMLTEYVNTLAPILGVGGDTTNLKTQIAQGFINAKASGQSIPAVLDGIEHLADAKLAQQAYGGNPAPAAQNQGSAPASGGGGTVTAAGFTFVQGPDGKWSVK